MRPIGRLGQGGAALFSLLQKARSAAYDRGLLRTERVDGVKVISVGNLRVGGTGKTPLVIHLAGRLRDRGLNVAVVTRGYRGRLERTGGPVSDGQGPTATPEQAGDEAFLLARRLPGVAVRVGQDRIEQTLLARDAGAEVVLLDDAFQHRRLHRDLDIVLVTPEDLKRGAALLPAGPLREPPAALGRADLVGARAGSWPIAGVSPDFLFDYTPTALIRKDHTEVPLASQRGAHAYLMAGVARPERLAKTADAAGLNVVGHTFFGDHHDFTAAEIARVEAAAKQAAAEIIATTEKDLSRLHRHDLDLPVVAIGIEVTLVSGNDTLEERLKRALGPSA